MPDNLKRQDRSIAINYLISEMIFRTFEYSPMKEQRLINMMDLMNYFEDYIIRENPFEDLGNGPSRVSVDKPIVRLRDKTRSKDKIRNYMEEKKSKLTTTSGTSYEQYVKWEDLEYTQFRSRNNPDPMPSWNKPKVRVSIYRTTEETRKKGRYVETIIKSFTTNTGTEFDKKVEERKEKMEAEKRASMMNLPVNK